MLNTLPDDSLGNRPTFKEEKSTPKLFRAKPDDYLKSGYDRGHLAPAADAAYSKSKWLSTFNFANVVPQIPQMNQGIWRILESYVANLIKQKYDDCIIITGPV